VLASNEIEGRGIRAKPQRNQASRSRVIGGKAPERIENSNESWLFKAGTY